MILCWDIICTPCTAGECDSMVDRTGKAAGAEVVDGDVMVFAKGWIVKINNY